jgi:hypothetical protein
MKRRTLLAALILFASLPSCVAGTRASAAAHSTALGRQVLPLPPDALISFSSAGGEVLRADNRALVRKLAAAPANYGRPIASNVDLGSLMAAVVHEHGLAVLNLTSSETEPVWLPLEWSKPPSSIFVCDAYAATLGGSEACFWDLTNAVLVFKVDLAAWSRDHRLGPAVCVVPDRSGARKATVLFSSEQSTDIQVLDFSRGTPEMIASASNIFQNTKKAWQIVERCAYDGASLFLSGTKEEVGLDTTGRPVPQPSPFLMKVDLKTREHEILFNENTHDRDQEVVELAAANGCVATVRRDGLLRVFRGHEKTYEAQMERGSAVTWLAEDSLAVYDASALRVIQLGRAR